MELKRCGCGQVPTKLNVSEGSTFRWRHLTGNCCGEWQIEVRVPTLNIPVDYDEYAWCCQEWNEATRVPC